MRMVSPKFMTCFFIYLIIFPSIFDKSKSESASVNTTLFSEAARSMFFKAFQNYMRHAWPHDELKPLTRSFTDSLSGFEKSKKGHQPGRYNGSSITLIESLSSLYVMGFHGFFKESVYWLSKNLNFDIDARINLYEWNTRVLGGLISAHMLATELLQEEYHNGLLMVAEDLGKRFLPAFDTPTGIPYAWINLKHGVMKNETTETSPAECGSLILEMGTLSRLASNPQFESAALRAIRKLWSMRSSLDLLGSKLNVLTGEWIEYSSGIGPGLDSFYEVLIKAHILFGMDECWTMFRSAYIAVQRYMKYGGWYKTVDMRTGEEIHCNPTSVQAIWPSIQVLIGDIASANLTHREFFSVWQEYGAPPERFIIDDEPIVLTPSVLLDYILLHHRIPNRASLKLDKLHRTERKYPLRPEFIESTFYLYQATKDPWYLDIVGKYIMSKLHNFMEVSHGFSSIKDLLTMKHEDHQPGYFLSETTKYLYLLYDDSFLDNSNYIFTTKGHPLPVMLSLDHDVKRKEGNEHTYFCSAPTDFNTFASVLKNLEKIKKPSALSKRVCPFPLTNTTEEPRVNSACHVPDANPDRSCSTHADCGVDLLTCIPRECGSDGYCGDKYFSTHFNHLRILKRGLPQIPKEINVSDYYNHKSPMLVFYVP